MNIRGLSLILVLATSIGGLAHADPLVIAHRGASGYLPEHTIPAFVLAYAQGADYLEPDVVLTRDGHPIVLHDLYLDAVTNVRDVFPGRARADGLSYAIDFTLDEIRRLNVNERVDPATGEPRYPGRFPPDSGRFEVVTLETLIELTQGLNRTTGRAVGIYPELKGPSFHASHGQDIAAVVLGTVERYGYHEREDLCIIQSFEPEPLIRLRRDLGTRLRLVQLLGENEWEEAPVDYEPMYTAAGLARIAGYADGIGPPLNRLVDGVDEDGQMRFSSLLDDAQRANLAVHPYTFRADQLPNFMPAEANFDDLLKAFFARGIDGLFIDHPDRAVRMLRERRTGEATRKP